ncbi:MAG: hypothetical protein JO080_01750 [Mucilaginibacter sp.]|nr:hypothetical protein [Mucilaginibacter sp.]
MERSINYRLSRAIAMIGIPACGIALFGIVLCSYYLYGELVGGITDGSIQGTLVALIACIIIVINQVYFFLIGFRKINVKREMRFWIFSISIYFFVVGCLIYTIYQDRSRNHINLEIAIGFYWLFFLAGSIGALYELIKSKRSTYQ